MSVESVVSSAGLSWQESSREHVMRLGAVIAARVFTYIVCCIAQCEAGVSNCVVSFSEATPSITSIMGSRDYGMWRRSRGIARQSDSSKNNQPHVAVEK